MALTKEEKWVLYGYGALIIAYSVLLFAKFKHYKKD
jgi:hypothetical protein